MSTSGTKSRKINPYACIQYTVQSKFKVGENSPPITETLKYAIQPDFPQPVLKYAIHPEYGIAPSLIPEDKSSGPDDPNSGRLVYAVQPPEIKPLYGIDEPGMHVKPQVPSDRSFFSKVNDTLSTIVGFGEHLEERFGKRFGFRFASRFLRSKSNGGKL